MEERARTRSSGEMGGTINGEAAATWATTASRCSRLKMAADRAMTAPTPAMSTRLTSGHTRCVPGVEIRDLYSPPVWLTSVYTYHLVFIEAGQM